MLSIIIPVYNKKNYIIDTLSSIVGLEDTEIVLVEDCSNDGSDQICRQYAKEYENIIYIQGEHKGVSVARNRGIEAAKGDLICFLDADDLYDRTGLQKAKRILETSDADVVVFDFVKFDNETKDVLEEASLSFPSGRIDENKIAFLTESIDKFIAHNVSNKIYRTSIIKEKNFQFYETISKFEDVTFFLKYYLQIEKTIYLKESVHYYRSQLVDSLVSKPQKNYEHLLYFIDCFKNILDNDLLSKREKKPLIGSIARALAAEEIQMLIGTKDCKLQHENRVLWDSFGKKYFVFTKVFIIYALITLFPNTALLYRKIKNKIKKKC